MDKRTSADAWFAALESAVTLAGFASTVFEDQDSPDDPQKTLIVEMPLGGGEDTNLVSLTILNAGDQIESFQLIQAWMPLGPIQGHDPVDLVLVNARAILGHAAVHNAEMYFRHVWPLPRAVHLTPGMIREWLSLFMFSADVVCELLMVEPQETESARL